MRVLMLILGFSVMSSSVFAQGPKASACLGAASKLEMIQLIAASEALAIQKGPRRDVAAIEVFALSKDGLYAHVNVTFSGSVGDSQPVTLKALINCAANGTLELE